MRVRMTTTMAGPDGAHDAGTEAVFDDVTARRLVDGGFAAAVDATTAEVAVVAAPETSVAPPPSRTNSVRRETRRGGR